MNMIQCENGVKCGHALFDLDEIATEWRERKTCRPCLFAEIDRKETNGAVQDSRQWMLVNGGIASSFLNDHSADYSVAHDGSR